MTGNSAKKDCSVTVYWTCENQVNSSWPPSSLLTLVALRDRNFKYFVTQSSRTIYLTVSLLENIRVYKVKYNYLCNFSVSPARLETSMMRLAFKNIFHRLIT
jgi:hypothetical protein